MKKTSLILGAIFGILITLSFVSAFGVSSPYWEDNPMKIYPGESETVNLNLQNMVGDEDVGVKAEIIEGADIARLKYKDFIVKAQTSNTMVPVIVTLPVGTTEPKSVKIRFNSKAPGSSEGVAMGTGMTISFDVLNSSVPAPKEIKSMMTIMAVIAAMVIITLIAVISIISILRETKGKRYR